MLFRREELRLPPQTPLPHPKLLKRVIAPGAGTQSLGMGKGGGGTGQGHQGGSIRFVRRPPVLPLGERGGGVLGRRGR